MKNRFTKLALIFSIIAVNIYGQPQRGNYDPSNMPKESKITGKVLDGATSGPVEYATIAIYSMRDSLVVSGGITDASGNFTIDNLPYGRFYIDISFIGFTKSRINGVMLNPSKKIVSLGEIKLEPATTALSEVEIVGNRSTVEYRIDKKIVSIAANVVAAGGSAVEALENVPSVQVDIEGNVALRGSSNFTVLIDGRPSVLKGSEALQQIPASAIQNIEIITNPSAKYDPEGNSGIINIIMKKQKQAGMNGVVNASVSSNGGKSADFLFNKRATSINYYIGANYNKMRFENQMQSDKVTNVKDIFGQDSLIFNEHIKGDGVFQRSGYGIKGGFDYYMGKTDVLSVSGSYRTNEFGRDFSRQNYSINDSVYRDTTIHEYNIQDNEFKRVREFWEINLDYTHKFNDNGHQVQAMFGISQGPPSTETTNLYQYLSDSTWVKGPVPSLEQNSSEGGREIEFNAKLDYSYPISGDSKIEVGYQGEYEGSEDDYNIKFNDVEDVSKSRDMTFIEQSHAMYTTYSGIFQSIGYLVGFRTEFTSRELNQKTYGSDVTFNKWDFFPSLHLSKKLNGEVQLQASYSRRIRRPGGRELDPVEIIIDSKNIRVGEPALSPEYTNSFEFNAQKSFKGAGFISGELFHRATNELISDYEYKRDNIITVQTFKNLSNSYSTGFEGMVNLPVTKWWTLNSSATLYDYRLSGDLSNSETADNNTFSWNTRLNNMIKFKWGTQLQIMGFYNAPSITAQGRREGFFFSNIGVRQDFFKKKLTLSVQVRDLFGDNKFERTTTGSNFTSFYSMKRQPRVITFSLSFKINNYKPDKKGRENMNEMEFDNGGGGGMM